MGFLKNHWVFARAGQATMLKDETLIQHPEGEMKRLCEFLDVPYSADMVAFHQDRLTRDNASKQSAWKNLAKSVITDNSEKFRKEHTPEEIAFVEKICFLRNGPPGLRTLQHRRGPGKKSRTKA